MNLWTTALNNIEFNDSCYPFDSRLSYLYHEDHFDIRTGEECKSSCIKFARAVNKVLLFHNVPVMKRFSLECVQDYRVYDVYSWVSMAVIKKIEELKLYIEAVSEDEAPIQLPFSLFTCETLKVLKLEGSIFVKMLPSCSLPRLETLELSFIQYENDESARKLISSCSSLQSLDIARDEMDGVGNFIVSSYTLKDLKIDQTYCSESDISNYSYVINSPCLQHLKLVKGSVNGFFIENLSSLVKTDITFADTLDIGLDDNISNLLQGVCNSKILNISGGIFQSVIPAHLFPKFDRLSTLGVVTNCCSWDSLQEFIKNSDRLEALSLFKIYYCKKAKHVVCCRNPETVPICLLSCLKTMTYSNLFGHKDELEMVEYILKYAKVLEKMEIHLQHPFPQDTGTRLREKLLKFPTGSEECEVIIY